MDLDGFARRILAASDNAAFQGLSRHLPDWAQDHSTVLYIFLALAVGFVISRRASRSSAFQNRSEVRVSRVLRKTFGPPDYHPMNHVTLQLKDGTTQVDHILVS